MMGQEALWSGSEVRTQAEQCQDQLTVWEALEEMPAHPTCPCCEGGGWVPSASGLTDVRCLCSALDADDRVILRGRADTLAAWGPSGQYSERLLSTMIHLVSGCVGPCRGNVCQPGTARCFL
jgi:hypothetical protein